MRTARPANPSVEHLDAPTDSAAERNPELLCAFGVIADVQYADIADGTSYCGTRVRRYRRSLEILKEAISAWDAETDPIAFVGQLGDLIDGQNVGRGETERAFAAVLDAVSASRCRTWIHVVGNHELMNLPRPALLPLLSIPPADAAAAAAPPEPRSSTTRGPGSGLLAGGEAGGEAGGKAGGAGSAARPAHGAYRAFSPHPRLKVLSMDAFDESVIGPARVGCGRGAALMRDRNPNDTSAPGDWHRGLEGLDRRFVPYNGAVSAQQLAWARDEAGAARAAGQAVVLLIHTPVHPGSADPAALLWNYDEVLALCAECPAVVATVSGHSHVGGYALDEHGVHHLNVEAPIECAPGSTAFATLHVYRDRIAVHGRGAVPSRTLHFRPSAC